MKKTILNSFVGALVFCLTCFGILYLVKARNSSSTGLPTDGDPSALYVNSNETLTAAKWNTMVKSTRREDVDLNDTANFNTGCERRTFNSLGQMRTPTSYNIGTLFFLTTTPIAYQISSTDKRKFALKSNTASYYDVILLQKKCQ